ncbi:hypothetical protein NDU88_001509 [Pleurodeles waltl]|uniref:Uncharacterized protein n=1 Tax=Pleurodeles waltl TaxID=8319 RepID=A0AAV7SZM9_PLEWA|nr:hypothetical protein NDU88_001509 [Pleurodeles waltl]
MSARSDAKKEVGSNRPKPREASDTLNSRDTLPRIMRVRFSDRINNCWHPQKQRRQPSTRPLTRIPLKMSARSDAKKEVGSNRPKPREASGRPNSRDTLPRVK